jgi:hypothetical protein
MAPRTSLGTLVLAAQFLDLLWPVLLLLGVEHVRIAPGTTRVTPLDFYDYPYSHSLLMVAVWGMLFLLVAYSLQRQESRAAVTLGILVLSHWVLDAIVHRPDLPLSPSGDLFIGLGLWNSVVGTLIVETGLFVLGVVIYAQTTVAGNRVGHFAFWTFVTFLYVLYLANVFGPAPDDVRAITQLGMGQWLLILWAWWLDRNRVLRSRNARPPKRQAHSL